MTLFKAIKSDLLVQHRRFEYIQSFFSKFQGNLGIYIRGKIITRYFLEAGENISIWPENVFRFPQFLKVGKNVVFSYRCIIQAVGGVSIGENTLFGPDVKIWTVNHSISKLDTLISEQGFITDPVEIGEDCWIGSNVFIKPGVLIPNGCVIFPHTVVSKIKIAPFDVLSGNPAKVIGSRNRIGAFMNWKKTGSDK